MIEEIIKKLAERPDVVRVAISDREGLLIAALRGTTKPGTPTDAQVNDDLWNAYLAQFAANMSLHLKNVTLSRPLEMVVRGTADALVVAWVNVGWLLARVTSAADWPTLWQAVRAVQAEIDTLTGEPVYAGEEG